MNAVTERPKLLAVMAARLGVEPENMLRILKNTCIKPTRTGKEATNEEVQAFLIVANRYDLNPLTREIYAFESNGAIIPIVSIDGWSTLVNRHEDFDGCDFETLTDADGRPVSITCRIYDKRRTRPVAVTEYLSECERPTGPWRTMPHRMLRHKAFIQASRLAFGLSGIYDEEEGLQIAKAELMASSEEQPKQSRGMSGLRGKLLEAKTETVQEDLQETLPQSEPAAMKPTKVQPTKGRQKAKEEVKPEIVEQKTMFEEPDYRQQYYNELKKGKTPVDVLAIGTRLSEARKDHADMLATITDQVLSELESD